MSWNEVKFFNFILFLIGRKQDRGYLNLVAWINMGLQGNFITGNTIQ